MEKFDEPTDQYTYQWLTALTALEEVTIFPLRYETLSYITSSRLKSLDINANPTANLGHISKLTSLRSLDVVKRPDGEEEGELDLGPDFLSMLSNLTRLSLSIKGPTEISHFPYLEQLELMYATNEEYTGLVDLPNITKLVVRALSPTVNGEISFISNLTTLQHLEMMINKQISCQIFVSLTSLASLSVYKVDDDCDHLSVLTNLTKLRIPNTMDSPKLLQLPTSLKELSLQLYKPMASQSVSVEIEARLPNLYKSYVSTTTV
jgi:hypothetical protein